MRQIYVDKFHLLPDKLTSDSSDVLYLRSTDVPRARESLLSILEGLYPADSRNGVYLPVNVYATENEYIAPNLARCPRIKELLVQNVVNNTEWMKKFMEVKDIVDKVNEIAGTKNTTFDDGYSVGCWSDVFRARECHNMPYPCAADGKTCVTQDMVDAIVDLGNWQNAHLYAGDEFGLLGAGPVFVDVSKSFASRVSTGKGPKYIHYSAHDTTLYAIIAGLKIESDNVAYASSIRMELWQTSSGSSPTYAVRMIYNNKVLRPPECESDMCPLEQFQNMVTSRLAIRDVARQCAPRTKSSM